MPVVQVQATDLRGSLVGESEQKTDNLLRICKAMAPCILFVDEAEKLFAQTDAARDGGAASGVLALFLSFMQSDKSGVFTVFTVNRMQGVLPPELIDRFEGRFFVDLPREDERESIINLHIARFDRDPEDYDVSRFVKETKNFNGRGIEAAVMEAFGKSFADDAREPTNQDFLDAFDLIGEVGNMADVETMRETARAGALQFANNIADGERDEDVDEDHLRFA